MTGRTRYALYCGIVAGLALVLAALDPLLSGDEFEAAEFGIDVLEKLLLFAGMSSSGRWP